MTQRERQLLEWIRENPMISQQELAEKAGITRSVIVNALRKFESAGIIESRSSGMKGTYIKVVNDAAYEEIEEYRKKYMQDM